MNFRSFIQIITENLINKLMRRPAREWLHRPIPRSAGKTFGGGRVARSKPRGGPVK
jgi:hypothetical protein